MKKRILAAMLAACLSISALSGNVLKADAEEVFQAECETDSGEPSGEIALDAEIPPAEASEAEEELPEEDAASDAEEETSAAENELPAEDKTLSEAELPEVQESASSEETALEVQESASSEETTSEVQEPASSEEETDLPVETFVSSAKLKRLASEITAALESFSDVSAITLSRQQELERILIKYEEMEGQGDAYLTGETQNTLNAAIARMAELVNSSGAQTTVKTGSTLDWSRFLGADGYKGVSDGKTPTTAAEVVKRWDWSLTSTAADWGLGPGAPIIVGDYVYYACGGALRKLRLSDGVQVAKASAPSGQLFFCNLLYAEGKIIVPRLQNKKTCIMVFDADTLEYLGSSAPFASGGQPQGQTCYYRGYVYLSSWGQENCPYNCYDLSAFTSADAVVQPTWSYVSAGGFNTNMGAAFVGNACIFATGGGKSYEAGTIVSVDYRTGAVIDSFRLPGKEYVSSELVYYEANNRVYISASSSPGLVIRSYEVNADGSLDQSSMLAYISDVSAGGSQSTPVICQGRIYIGGGGSTMGSSEPFHVIDAYTMEEIYRIDELLTKGSAAVSTSYATEGNDSVVYIYMVPYAPETVNGTKTSTLYIISDRPGQTEPVYEKVTDVGYPQYSSQSIAIGKDGSLVFYNDAMYLYCYGNANQNTVTSADVEGRIAALPEAEEYRYLNKTELLRLSERANAAGISDAVRAKLNNLLDTVNASGETLGAYLSAGIAALPDTVTTDDADMITNLWQLFLKEPGLLSAEDEEKLTEAKQELDGLLLGASFSEAVKAIEAIPEEISTESEEAIDYAKSLYEALTAEDKNRVPENLAEKLSKAESALEHAKETIAAFRETLKGIDDIDPGACTDREGLEKAYEAIRGIKDALRQAKRELTPVDDANVQRLYDQSLLSFKRHQIIEELMNKVLYPNGEMAEITEESREFLIYAANIAQFLYADISGSDREYWNHDADMTRIRRLLLTIDRQTVLKEKESGKEENSAENSAKNPGKNPAKNTAKNSTNTNKSAGSSKTSGSGTRTGDGNQTELWLFLCAVSAFAAIFLFANRKKFSSTAL